MSPYAPRMITIQINPDKIRDVIGPGGKIIKKIVEETGVQIDIEDDGKVFIMAVDMEAGKKAVKIIEGLVREVEVGAVYTGKVTRLMNFRRFCGNPARQRRSCAHFPTGPHPRSQSGRRGKNR